MNIFSKDFMQVWAILAVKDKVFCCRKELDGWGILVVRLDGPNTTQKHFTLQEVTVQ